MFTRVLPLFFNANQALIQLFLQSVRVCSRFAQLIAFLAQQSLFVLLQILQVLRVSVLQRFSQLRVPLCEVLLLAANCVFELLFAAVSLFFEVFPLPRELFSVLQKQGALSDAATRFYTASVIATFTHLHSLKVIYRDLKPENLLLDERGYLLLVDFAMAKVPTITPSSAPTQLPRPP